MAEGVRLGNADGHVEAALGRELTADRLDNLPHIAPRRDMNRANDDHHHDKLERSRVDVERAAVDEGAVGATLDQ